MAELRPLQQEALVPLRDRFVHADPLGSGKTPVGLRWLDAHVAGRSLIVAPSNVVRHWQKLAAVWYPDLHVEIAPKGATPKQRAAALAAVRGESFRPVAYVTTYALLRQDEEELVSTKWGAALFDEAHRLKGRTTLVHKAAVKIARRTPLLDLSTGSPILNSAEETWSLLHLLDPRTYSSFWTWTRDRFWVEMTDFHGKLPRPIPQIGDPKPGAIERITAEFGLHLVMRDESVMLPQLEAPEHIFYEIDLTPAERRLYDSMQKRFWMKKDDEVVFASNTVSQITRLRQLSSDWSSALGEADKGSKVSATVELVEDLHPKRVLVFVSFKQTAYQLVRALEAKGIFATTFTGDDDEEQRDAALDSFVRGDLQVLIGTYGALAEGTDGLQHASHHVVLLDHDWVPDIERQAIGRLRRDGQRYRVIVHHIIARDTIDQTIADAHEQKLDVVEAITGRRLREVLTGSSNGVLPCLTSKARAKSA